MARSRARFEAALRKGHTYNWDQRWEEAINEFQVAIEEVPSEPAPYDGLGTAYKGLNQLEKALENYKLAARYSRGDIIYLRQVAELQEELGHPGEAGKTYMAIGEVELSRRRLKEAMDNWLRAINLEPNLLRAHQRLASIYKRQGATHSAIREYLAIARILQMESEQKKALQACRLALELDPRNKDVLTAIETVKQGKPLFPEGEIPGTGELKKGGTAQDGVPRMTAALKGGEDGQLGMEAASPVQDARRVALEQLAQRLFEDVESVSGPTDMERNALLSQALDSQTRGMTNEAIGAYEKAIASGINSPAAHFNLGLLYQDKLRFEDAIREFEISVRDHDFRLASHFALGESHRARGRIEEAVEHFITVLKIVDLKTVQHEQADRLIELYENLADSLVTKGEREQATDFANALVEFLSHKGWEDKVKEARSRLDTISKADMMILGDVLTAGSEYVLESLYLSQEYTRRNMYDTAIEEIYRAIQLSPEYLPAHIQLAEVLAQQGRREAASRKFVTIANTYRARGDVNGGIAAYEKVIELSPMDLTVRARLIDLLRQHHRIDRALEHYVALGEAYYQLAQVDKARESYQEGLKLASQSADTDKWKAKLLQLTADIDMQRLDWKRALSCYKELCQLRPEDERAAITLVDLYYKVGQPANALKVLDQYLIQLVRKGRGAKVVGILEDMVSQRPSDANLVDRLYRLYIQQKRRGDAIDLLDKLGEAQLETEDTTAAIKTIEKILKLNPPNAASYQQLLAQLNQ